MKRFQQSTLVVFLLVIFGFRAYGELPVEEFTGILEQKKHDIQPYFAIRLEKPVLAGQKEVDEAQLLIVDEVQLQAAYSKIGSKIWVQGTLWPAEPGFYYLDAAITVNEMQFK